MTTGTRKKKITYYILTWGKWYNNPTTSVQSETTTTTTTTKTLFINMAH